MSNRILVFSFFLMIFLIACDTEDTFVSTVDVSDQLQPYVDRFEMEAASRGMFIDVDRIGVHLSFADIPTSNVLGVCYYHSNAPGRIEIDEPVWQRLSDAGREYVVFHELGHCVLNRGHLESQYINGSCKSIMASGTGSCYENYTRSTRSRYLNELFAIQ